MLTLDVSVMPSPDSTDDLWKGGADRYDYSRLPGELQSQAMLAQGTVVEGLSSAVRRVIEAGQALSWAKSELPHGEYLPWVQQACGLRPQHAQKLIKAAEWANAVHARHLDQVTDATTLFLLSADTTPEEVREWFMERCAAGDVPSRAEVQDRKRTAGRPREPQPAEAMALALIRKGELHRVRQALEIAEQASVVTPQAVMEEQRLRDLGKLRYIPGSEADFHRMKDGSWVRLPHAGAIDAELAVASQQVEQSEQAPPSASHPWDEAPLLDVETAAIRLGMKPHGLSQQLTPGASKRRGGRPLIRNGFAVARAGRGMVRLTPVSTPAQSAEHC
jgi:hypothetical protein